MQQVPSANLFRKECQGCNEDRKLSRPAPYNHFSGAIPSHDAADSWLRPVSLVNLCGIALDESKALMEAVAAS